MYSHLVKVVQKNKIITSTKRNWGRSVIGIFGSLIWSKTLMEPIFNPCGEFRWSPKGPVSQIHSPHLHVGAPGIVSDLLRSVQMLKREWGAEDGKLPHLSISSNCSLGFWVCGGRLVIEQNCSLGSWVCSEGPALGQITHDDEREIRKFCYSMPLGIPKQFWVITCDGTVSRLRFLISNWFIWPSASYPKVCIISTETSCIIPWRS